MTNIESSGFVILRFIIAQPGNTYAFLQSHFSIPCRTGGNRTIKGLGGWRNGGN